MIFMVRAQLLHLSGPFRGRTDTYAPTKLTIGSADGVEVRFPGGAPVKRWQEATGKDVVLEETKLTFAEVEAERMEAGDGGVVG